MEAFGICHYKSSSASTWKWCRILRNQCRVFQAQLPEDVTLTYEFDQSVYVINALKSLLVEGAIGAILTGLMVLLFR
jgi:multidrug efflux pump subunit AcrB